MSSQNKKIDNLQAILGLSIWEQEKWENVDTSQV
jgi:hypothetical protein